MSIVKGFTSKIWYIILRDVTQIFILQPKKQFFMVLNFAFVPTQDFYSKDL